MNCVSCRNGVLRNLGVGDKDSPGQSQRGGFHQMARTLMTGELYISIILASKCLGVNCSYISHVCALLLLLILRWGMFHERDETV